MSTNFAEKNAILEQCKRVLCVDLGESFQTHTQTQYFLSKFGFDTAQKKPPRDVDPMLTHFLRGLRTRFSRGSLSPAEDPEPEVFAFSN